MLAGQVKEVIKGYCAICGEYKDVSFYSYKVCRDCHVCPACGETDSLQSFTHICVETMQQLTGVQCGCGAKFRERTDMDTKLLEKHQSKPHRICVVCHADVVSATTEVEGFANFCDKCRVCPRCNCKAIAVEKGKIECSLCGQQWDDWRDFEEHVVLTAELGENS